MKRTHNLKSRGIATLALALVSALGLAQVAHADATANIIVDAAAGDTVSDMMTVITGGASAQGSGGRIFGVNQSHLFQVNASASGDSGSIALSTQQISNNWNGSAFAGGAVFDTLIFQGRGPAEVEFTMSVIGGFFNTGGPSFFSADAELSMSGGGSSTLRATWTDTPGSLVTYLTGGDVTLLGASNEPQQIQGTLRVRALVVPGTEVTVSGQLRLQTSPARAPAVQANSLFNHTAQLGVTLPEGWSFTSASGTFLGGQGTAAAPEPSALGLLALGVLPLALYACRKPRF